MKHEEPEFGEDVEDEGRERQDYDGQPLPDLSIESGKAFDMFWNHRRQKFCDKCEPLIVPHENEFGACRCDFYEHFVGSRWLCLPCFFVEETKAYQVIDRKITGYVGGRWGYKEVRLY